MVHLPPPLVIDAAWRYHHLLVSLSVGRGGITTTHHSRSRVGFDEGVTATSSSRSRIAFDEGMPAASPSRSLIAFDEGVSTTSSSRSRIAFDEGVPDTFSSCSCIAFDEGVPPAFFSRSRLAFDEGCASHILLSFVSRLRWGCTSATNTRCLRLAVDDSVLCKPPPPRSHLASAEGLPALPTPLVSVSLSMRV